MSNLLKSFIMGLGAIMFTSVASAACAIEYGEIGVCPIAAIENGTLLDNCTSNGGELAVNRTKGVLDYNCMAPGDVAVYSIIADVSQGTIAINSGTSALVCSNQSSSTISKNDSFNAYASCLAKLQSQAASLMFK